MGIGSNITLVFLAPYRGTLGLVRLGWKGVQPTSRAWNQLGNGSFWNVRYLSMYSATNCGETRHCSDLPTL